MARPSFTRTGGKFKPQPTVLVICEDSKSGKSYLQDAAQHFRAYVHLEIVHCGATDPGNIVKEALKRRARFEQVYCVIDRDRHETFASAQRMLKASKVGNVELIVSYPCYEFWLLLHFGYCRPAYQAQGNKSPGEMVVADLREKMEKMGMQDYAKGDTTELFARLLTRLPDARKNAAKVQTDVAQTGEPNPSTDLHLLLDQFEVLGQLQPAIV
jgi:RloB-like protein